MVKGTPTGKRLRDGSRTGAVGSSSMKKKLMKDISMTPDTFERSQARLKKKVQYRPSLNESYDGDITQMVGTYGEDDSMLGSDGEHTPATLSQISAINPNDTDMTFAKRRKNLALANETWEIAVEHARGEPDGAERSFTRKNLAKISLKDEEDGDDDGEADMSGVIEEGDEEAPTPVKKAKMTPLKEKKGGLKKPFEKASKKLKSMKNPVQVMKVKKQVNKNFEALPDETTVPKTPNQTWKEKKKERKMMKNNYDLIASAKKAWEDLRRADLTDVKRKSICDDLMKLITGKVKQLSMVHDSSRVLQCVVQYGSEEQRCSIFNELKKDMVEVTKSKYSKFIVRKLLHYGSKPLKAEVMNCFHGHVRKLIRHKEASEIIEYAFNEYATAPQRLSFLEEFYGPSFFLFKDNVHRSLEQIMKDMPEKREMVLRSMKESLTPLIDKELLAYSLVHKAFFDFFTYATESSKKEIIDGLKEHIPHLLHTRDGTRVAMHCVWSGSAKERKVMVKSLKTHVLKICKEEHGHMLLMTIFDNVDDTVLVHKVIVDEMMKKLEDVIADQHGRKVLLYLMASRDTAYFHPDIVKILAEGDANTNSKKDKAVRFQELRTPVSPKLLQYVVDNAETMMTNNNKAMLTKAIIMNAVGDVAPAMRALASVIAKPTKGETMSMVEHPACHIIMKKIIANDKPRMERGEGVLFSAVLLEALPKSALKMWAASNRGCFILICLLEVGCSTVTERVVEQLEPLKKSLNKMTFKGAELLLERLSGMNAEKPKKEFRV